jgi:peptidoglycan/xylan/chitin deacetylase (PgdA/CDA1 family)
MRVQKVDVNQDGNGAILIKILENGTFHNKLFFIKDKTFTQFHTDEQINDFTLDNETLLIATSDNAIALNMSTGETIWQTELKESRKILPITTGHLLFTKNIAWLRTFAGELQPLFLCSAPACAFDKDSKPIVAISKGNTFCINTTTGMIERLHEYPQDVITATQNSKGRLLTREIKKSFYHNVVCFKETASGKQIDIIKEAKLNYTLYQPEIKGDLHFKAGEKYEIALMFDCLSSGEGIFEIIEALKQYKIRSNFFLNGDFIRNSPILTREISLQDAEIGNLFDSNINFSGDTYTIDKTFIRQGLSCAEENYFAVTGKNFAPYWHSPLFIYNTSIVEYGLDSGYKFVSYQFDSMDWIDKNDRNVNSKFYMNNEKLTLRLLENLKPSQTVLFSTGFNGIERDEWLFEDIDTILCELQRSGYTFSYMSSILNRYRKQD